MVAIAKLFALMLSILTLLWLLTDAFFVPGSAWQDRLVQSVALVGLAGSVCLAGGFVFELPDRKFDPEPPVPLTQTLPVRLFFWAVGLMAVLFAVSWFLAEDFVPLIWKNQPY